MKNLKYNKGDYVLSKNGHIIFLSYISHIYEESDFPYSIEDIKSLNISDQKIKTDILSNSDLKESQILMKVTKDFDLEHLLNDFPEFYI
jgi:hypothetical protein